MTVTIILPNSNATSNVPSHSTDFECAGISHISREGRSFLALQDCDGRTTAEFREDAFVGWYKSAE